MQTKHEPSWDEVKAMPIAALAQLSPGDLGHLIEAEHELEREVVVAHEDTQQVRPGVSPLSRFGRVKDESFRDLGFAVVRGPLDTVQRDILAAIRQRYRILGVASYKDFPAPQPGDPTDYPALAEAWCHCFRAPEEHGLAGRPSILLPESDFSDPDIIELDNLQLDPDEPKQFDFAYASTPAKTHDKNWALARECIPILCNELGLRGVIYGRDAFDDVPACENLTVFGCVPWLVSLLLMHRSRMLLVPSVLDASPRVLGEALCLDVPVLVNRHILGGWHYVNAATGASFESAADVGPAALQLLGATTLSPRKWFVEHHGWERSGARLYEFLRTLDPTLRPAKGAFIINDF